MKLITPISLPDYTNKIEYGHRITTIGSCFSQVIGDYLDGNKFQVASNPFGTIYNPISIFKLLTSALDGHDLDTQGFVESDGVCHHFDIHSDLSGMDRSAVSGNYNVKRDLVGQQLSKNGWLIMTFGTVIVYKLKEDGRLVANCHKVSQREFYQEHLGSENIKEPFNSLMDRIKTHNPQLRIIVTVSPVRHIRDGLVDNMYSKSLLRVLCQWMADTYDQVDYFPSYEIMMDELRDYRFYAEDLIHPSREAEKYICSQFQDSFYSKAAKELQRKWEKVRSQLNHRPRFPQTNTHRKALENVLEELNKLNGAINVDEELQQVKFQLDQLS